MAGEVDELRDHPDRFDAFGRRLAKLDDLMGRMVPVAPQDIADATGTIADAVRSFAADAAGASSVTELVAAAPDFDSGALGRAGDDVEDHADANCGVDLDLD